MATPQYNMRNVPKYIEDSKNHMQYREFWIVDKTQNYVKELQGVLDVYYNDYEDCYSAEVLPSQNTTRLVIKCNLCNTTLSSWDPFVSHNNGKSHKKLVNQACSKHDKSENDFQIVRFKSVEDLENPFEESSFEYELFATSFDIVGYQFIYREIFENGEQFTCQLCCRRDDKCKQMKQKRAFKHITSEQHIKQYLRVKFDVDLKHHPYQDPEKCIEDVKEKEGKIQCKIFTIDHTAEDRERRSCFKNSWVTSKDDTRSSRSPSADSSSSDPVTETISDFMFLITQHLANMKGEGDNITDELQKDDDAVDLLIATAKVLSQKIYLYSQDKNNYESDAKSLWKKAELLKPVIYCTAPEDMNSPQI